MWLCRSEFWRRLRVRSDGMPFSIEIKLEAIYYEGARWRETPIIYHARLGTSKLRIWSDGLAVLAKLVTKKWFR